MSTMWGRPGTPLSQREMQVCRMVAEGMTTKQIARELQCSPRTVEDHRLNAYAKYQVNNIMGLLHKLTAEGLPCPCCGRAAE